MNKAEKVHEITEYCLAEADFSVDDSIVANGLVNNFAFSTSKLKERKQDVIEILAEMHPNFRRDIGGGWTFLNLPMDKNDHHWCEQPTAEKLVALGIGLGLVKYSFPRELWNNLPGGVPYIVIDLGGNDEQ